MNEAPEHEREKQEVDERWSKGIDPEPRMPREKGDSFQDMLQAEEKFLKRVHKECGNVMPTK